MVDPPLVTSGRVGHLLFLLSQPAPHPTTQNVSTELTRLYTGLYSAELDFGGSTLEASGLVSITFAFKLESKESKWLHIV